MSTAAPAATSSRRSVGAVVGTWGIPALVVLLFVAFSLLRPDTFPTFANVRSIMANQSIPALLALGATIPIVTGRFDVSIGYGFGLAHVLCLWLIVQQGVPWPVAVGATLVLGLVVGLVNGFLVELAQIDSFIATLGTGSVLFAVSGAITGGGRIVPGTEGLPGAFTDLVNSELLGLPVAFWYVVVLVVVLYVVLEHLPLGRWLYVVGANPRAAELVAIPKRRVVVYAFVGSGVVTAAAGVLLASQQRIGNPSVGLDYLLPAFVGALLGSTTIRPGRANALGTLVAVTVLAVGLSGIQQLGAEFWATPLFNGLTLLAAVGLAGYAARRRARSGSSVGAGSRATGGPSTPGAAGPGPSPDGAPPTGPATGAQRTAPPLTPARGDVAAGPSKES